MYPSAAAARGFERADIPRGAPSYEIRSDATASGSDGRLVWTPDDIEFDVEGGPLSTLRAAVADVETGPVAVGADAPFSAVLASIVR